ncbi:hypothetical protein T10_11787 [Trichinella papuae]|uniref:Uncharacterized protein n=1 Tax=Trichinella papuae TaxID=268474 RepID=A0A0V1MLE8_9BILA|nr:hypothetical protein T10_11787 [Trichinella papuae]
MTYFLFDFYCQIHLYVCIFNFGAVQSRDPMNGIVVAVVVVVVVVLEYLSGANQSHGRLVRTG